MAKPTVHLPARRRDGKSAPARLQPIEMKSTATIQQPEKAADGAPLPQEELRAWIARAAYFRAEGRGFVPGRELEDWLAAEEEVTRALPQGSRSAADSR